MNYQLYKNTRDASWQFLIDFNICKLPFSFSDVCSQLGISLLRDDNGNQFQDGVHGLTFAREGQYYIMVNGVDSIPEQRCTIGHELGHILLGHLSDGEVHERKKDENIYQKKRSRIDTSTDNEYQAERFSMGILAPACVLYGLNIRSTKDIESLCNIPHEEAKARADRMRELYKRDKFFTSDTERIVYEQFKPFIDDYNRVHEL